MKTKEWVAVAIAVFVVGFFFIFGQTIITIFNTGRLTQTTASQGQLLINDTVIGTGDEVVNGSSVVINYTGRFTDGKVFDSSVTRGEPFQFVVGAGQVIKGLDQGIIGMRTGGKRTLTIPPDQGYGANDFGPIPGNSTLLFDIEVIKINK